MLNISKSCKVTRVMNAVAAGATVQTGAAVDMKNFEGVTFILGVGALTADQVTALKAQQSSDDGSADAYSDLEGTLTGPFADDDDNQVMILEIIRPQKRYVKPIVNRATANAVIDFVIAIQHTPKAEPVTHDATTVAFSELHVSPDEGTA
ncbi:MAG: hypothetical protein AB7O81_34885 [Blastocatellales bacterium]